MTQAKCSFYKYSKAKTLQVLNVGDAGTEKELKLFVPEFENKWQSAVSVGSYDNWLLNMFKSIKILDLSADGTILFYTLPLDILFDSNESQLEKIRLNHWWYYRGGNYSVYLCNKFETKYINLKNTFNQQGKKIKVLQCLSHYHHFRKPCLGGFKYIESKHIVLESAMIELFIWGHHTNLHLRAISFHNRCYVASASNCDTLQNVNSNKNIDTLRFIDINRNFSTNIYNNENLIESLNFDNSVKNMTISVEIDVMHQSNENDDWAWSRTISNLVVKKNFYHLTKLNILFKINNIDDAHKHNNAGDITMDWLFDILKKHEKLLKHQFGQLNIGLNIAQNNNCQKCLVLEWNSNIDKKALNLVQIKYNHSRQSRNERNTNLKKYNQLLNQWL